MKPANFGGAKNNRRIVAVNRLKEQLNSGRKPFASKQAARAELIDYQDNGVTASSALNEVDKLRIKKEIAILESRIVSNDVAISQRTKKYRGGLG